MLTDTKFSHSLTDTKHYWSLYKKMAIMYRIVYFSGLKFAQSQWAIRLKSFFFFLYWIVYAHIPALEIHILSIKQKALTTRKRKKINQFTYLDFVFVNFWTDGNIAQWKFYKNFHLLSAGLKFFPGENAERESLNTLCTICMGFSLTVFRKVKKPFHYSNCFFFFSPLHLGKWPIPSSQAQQYEQGRYSLRGCNAQTRGEALLHTPGVNF